MRKLHERQPTILTTRHQHFHQGEFEKTDLQLIQKYQWYYIATWNVCVAKTYLKHNVLNYSAAIKTAAIKPQAKFMYNSTIAHSKITETQAA